MSEGEWEGGRKADRQAGRQAGGNFLIADDALGSEP